MKQRFSSLDIKVIAHELSRSLLSLRVVNIYDLSSRIFLIKFAKPDHREQLVIDSGFRCHLSSFARTTAAAPSAFVARLRKFLRTRRVTSVSQVGTDRILEFQFSDGQYRLFLEFYAGGNIVLTDGELRVIALLRTVTEGAEHERIHAGSSYNLSERQNINGVPVLDAARVKDGLEKYVKRQTEAEPVQRKKWKTKAGDDLRKALAGSINEYPPMLLDHALRCTGFDTALPPADVLKDDGLVEAVLKALQEAGRVVAEITGKDKANGYIIAKPNISSKKSADAAVSEAAAEVPAPQQLAGLMYDDFHPFRPKQFEDDPETTILEFEGFNQTVDEFFSSIEGQKLEARLHEREEQAKKKLENARQDQAKRLGALQTVQELNVRRAQAIEANLERVEEAAAAINGLIASGKDWVDIERLVELEQKRQNPVAEIIKLPLKLYENTITLLLGEWEFGIDEDEEGDVTESEPSESDDETPLKTVSKSREITATTVDKRLAIDIDLALSAWSNAREYYDQKKTAAAKEEKTLLASTKALKSQQNKIESDLQRALKQEKAVLRPVRIPLWFEKFIYFISSDGYLVIGGKDAQQNESIYRRYLKKGDIYVHADLNGAAPFIIKNNSSTPDAPIPPSTLSQAGSLAVATSVAWDSKAVMSAWWVNADQVTKMASTGDYLDGGRVAIRGEKKFLPPAQLLLGFAVLFQISEESKGRHNKYRIRENGADHHTDAVPHPHGENNTDSHDHDVDEFYDDAEDLDTASDADDDVDQTQRLYSNPLELNEIGIGEDNTVEEIMDGNESADEEENTLAAECMDSTLRTNATKDAHQIGTSAPPNEVTAPPNIEPLAPDMESSGEDSAAESIPSKHAIDNQKKSKRPIPVRGKRGKKKKIAAKYADQDEEDRAEAMRLLGSKAGQEKAEAEAKAKKAREEEAELQRQRRREQHQRAQMQGKEREEQRRHMHQDNDIDDEDQAVNTDLDALVGTPLPGDEILDAIPVCAPWSALTKCKYKVKLQPGSQKKGKAVREILNRWAMVGANPKFVDQKSEDPERMWPKEVELIKGWKDTEVFNVMPVSKVRVMMPSVVGGGGTQPKGRVRGGKGSKKAR